jgi:hypothetical protein
VSELINENEATDLSESEPVSEEVTREEGDEAGAEELTDTLEITPDSAPDALDYESIIADDIARLKAEFPELVGIRDITDLNNPLRYAALRDLGLSPAEAYLATAKRSKADTRAHLKSAHGRNAAPSGSSMSYAELTAARELFPGKNDAELARLYRRVTK